MQKVITITGKETISIPPDNICINITLEGEQKTYDKLLKSSSEAIEELSNCFEKVGIDRTELKVSKWNVSTKFEHYRNIKGSFKQKLTGYKFLQSLIAEFPIDDTILGKLLFLLPKCSVKPKFTISYFVKETQQLKEQLLQKAVEDANKKAKILTNAANVQLGEIISIDHSWKDINFYSSPILSLNDLYHGDYDDYDDDCEDCSDSELSIPISLTPENISASDSVTITWSIL